LSDKQITSHLAGDWAQLERVNLRDQVVQAIQTAILERRYPPGAQLPSEHKLSKMLGVSRSSVREAIRHLAAVGLVTTQQGLGVFVAQPRPGRVLDSLLPELFLSQPSLRHLLEVRQAVEGQTSALAAQRATRVDVADLEVLVHTLDSQRREPQAYAHSDRAFHHRIAEASGNPLFPRILDLVHGLFMRELLLTVRPPGATDRSFPFHRRIFEAIRDGDPAAAERAMREHLLDVHAQLDALEVDL
jgi:GntR family transcriptional repressor for pyruvate dehydrogenase complex